MSERKKTFYRRSGQPPRRRRPSGRRRGFCENPRIDPQLKKAFDRIGVPEAEPFKPDPFQVEALEKIRDYDVLVSAPTGSGKTWIASQAISSYLAGGKKSWYASPLKALSNSIYRQFQQEFGKERCGILTGDRKENPEAPIIVGTTEILRNQLYDAMQEGTSLQADLVILDEAHYLSDPDRGVVWEEVLIYLPARVRLLLLSATLSNAEEIAEWLEENRGVRTWVVQSHERPVPLEMLFLFPDGLLSPLGGKRGLVPRVKKFVSSGADRGKRRRSPRLNYGEILRCLRIFDLLPAIFFLKSRVDCDQALATCSPSGISLEKREKVRREVKSFLRKYPHLEGHRQIGPLLDSLVGAHHAGQLPYWKVLIETLMNKGYLEAIFSTSTVAAGVNFPARTVVLVQSDRFNGREFSDLTATDLHQMTGRAGRRGKDQIGFALVIPGIHQDPQLIQDLRDSPPEPLKSQIHINFSMTLNLLLSHRPEEVRTLLDRSFAHFQEKRSGGQVSRKWKELLEDLRRLLPRAACGGDPYEIREFIQKRERWQREIRRLGSKSRKRAHQEAVRKALVPGRLFIHRNGQIFAALRISRMKERDVCFAVNVRERSVGSSSKAKPKIRRIALGKVKALLDHTLDLSGTDSAEMALELARDLDLIGLQVLPTKYTEEEGKDDALGRLMEKVRSLPCQDCTHTKICHSGKNKELKKLLNKWYSLGDAVDGISEGLWASFKRHLRFLKETGFVDSEDRLTPDGIWASKLRLDQPLLIAEAIRKGAFEGVPPEILAGCLAPFVWDRDQEIELKAEGPFEYKALRKHFSNVLKGIEEIRRLKAARGFDSPQILFWPAVAVYLWSKGVPWEPLISFLPVDEGDMASLIIRTADHLRQVANLEETHPELARTAKTAIDLIIREPVFIE
ncbi:MAG: DEAD/DEAH box helicase [Deltaproteobacteria bacterium]|nr:DEAD/DEAH box helicase [Deltaproteobacteria bacterium]MBW2016174.1 DEAD/DEAH box helicase [Deltaproteobacteria bacterium]